MFRVEHCHGAGGSVVCHLCDQGWGDSNIFVFSSPDRRDIRALFEEGPDSLQAQLRGGATTGKLLQLRQLAWTRPVRSSGLQPRYLPPVTAFMRTSWFGLETSRTLRCVQLARRRVRTWPGTLPSSLSAASGDWWPGCQSLATWPESGKSLESWPE